MFIVKLFYSDVLIQILVSCNIISVRRLSDVYIIQTSGSNYEEKLCVFLFVIIKTEDIYLYYVAALIFSIFMEITVSFMKNCKFRFMVVV